MKSRFARVLGLLLLGCVSSSVAAVAELPANVESAIQTRSASWIELRRDLHRHPEPSGQEERTARVVAERLRAAGLELRTEVGGHGLVAVLHGDPRGPVVGYRADMDAAHSNAADPVDFASETPGVRHICGHDVHTAVAVGLAEALASLGDALPGTVVFYFQPAEENGTGAAAMLADGALDEPRPDAVYAVHCAPLPLGTLASRSGIMLPAFHRFRCTLRGEGDLSTAADNFRQAVAALSAASEGTVVAQAWSTEPGEGRSLVVGGMLRAVSDERDQWARGRLEESATSAELPGVESSLELEIDVIPAARNDPALHEAARARIDGVLGEGRCVVLEETTPHFSEDFARFQREIPGVLLFLGVSNEAKGIVGMPHSPDFAVDEEAIAVGVRAMSAVLLDRMGGD